MTVEGRKTRSDKKRPIGAPLTEEQYEHIHELSYLCEMPKKTIGEQFTLKGYLQEEIINAFQLHFRRNLTYKTNRFIIGHLDNERHLLKEGPYKRLAMRLKVIDHENISALAHAMDLSVQGVTAAIITEVLERKKIMYSIMAQLIRESLDADTETKIRRIANRIDAKSPHDHITINMVLGYALERAIEEQTKVRFILDSWVRSVNV